LRAFRLRPHASQLAHIKHLMTLFKVEREPRRGDMIVAKSKPQEP
jgi:hypothetical protein